MTSPLLIATLATPSRDNMPKINRRDFLKLSTTGLLTASGLLGLGALFRFMGYESESATKLNSTW